MRHYHHNNGFTLLEVLVAFLIFSIAIAIIYQIYAKGTTATILAEEYTTAVSVAESQLAKTSIVDQMDVDEETGIEFEKYHWQIDTDSWDNELVSTPLNSPYELKQVSVVVTWQSRGHEREVRLTGLKPYIKP